MRNLFVPLIFFFSGASSQVMWQFNKDTVVTWHYREGDEFNGSTVNTNYWEYTYGWSRSIYNQMEQQYYTDGYNHKVENGILTLNAKKQPVFEKVVDWKNENDSLFIDQKFAGLNKRHFNYTAGMIQSRREMKYGYFEIKFILSPQKGYWPAFWMYGGTPNEEIDFCELKTEKRNKIHVGRHSQKENENKLPYFLFKKKLWGDWVTFKGDLTNGYNVIAGEWTKDYIKYYLNGECIAYTKLSMNVPKRLVANIAVPGGPFKPWPTGKDTVMGEFKIDYIRVWMQDDPSERTIRNAVADSFIINRDIGKSSLKSKSKFLYGKRSVHKNEGFFVSIFPLAGKKYKLTVVGKNIPADASFTLLDKQGQVLMNGILKYGESILNTGDFHSNEIQFVIKAFGKKGNCSLSN